MSGLSVLLVTDFHFLLVTSHSSSHEAIDTSDLSVGIRVDSLPLMRLESSWDSGDFLHDFLAFQRLDSQLFLILQVQIPY